MQRKNEAVAKFLFIHLSNVLHLSDNFSRFFPPWMEKAHNTYITKTQYNKLTSLKSLSDESKSSSITEDMYGKMYELGCQISLN